MSRVGKHAVMIPNGINVNLDKNILTIVKGNVTETYNVPECLDVKIDNGTILFVLLNKERETRALWGTTQRNVTNLLNGLVTPFKVSLKLSGVGYKAALKGKQLVLQLGYSHEIVYDIPEGITIACQDPTTINITSASKKQAGEVAAVLRSFRKPEPYKGKGVIRVGEFVYRKEGKKK